MKNKAILVSLFVVLAIAVTISFMRVHEVRQAQNISPVYQKDVHSGRLSPAAARSLSPDAPLLNAMNEYVDRVEAERKRIDKMPISKAEKHRLIIIAMDKASQQWKSSLSHGTKSGH